MLSTTIYYSSRHGEVNCATQGVHVGVLIYDGGQALDSLASLKDAGARDKSVFDR